MSAYSTYTDEALVVLLKQGDELAYAQIYDRYWPLLFRFSRRMLQNDEDAGDVVQDIFVMIWSKSQSLELKVSLNSFLYASVRNRILKHFEKTKVRSSYLKSLETFIDRGEEITDHTIREQELAKLIEREINLLPLKMREIFLLSRTANMSYKEIAEQLNISELTVKKQVSNALKILKLKLGSLFSIAIAML
ncbi:RNA polymerase sigma-70 factor (ECF subfamily) [Pedobacter sp. AK017]|uniref:RNA polymerase sigma factor n=1 Tax=Pedobacter sp. AK017 TaxID=2723073 RepID=UPI00161716BB|nr:RNA polymerase sigma-70 factor [Pedobacter sp. AK017]MBB5439393.1 RNA polymerase sigma-70 factor (ECF subfamily) [Pedobacter sp. AK017]